MSALSGFVAGLIVATPVCVVVALIGLCLRRPLSEIFVEASKFAVEIALEALSHSL